MSQAVPGFVDLLTMSNSRVRKIGIWHMGINLMAVVIFGINLIVRLLRPEALTVPLALSIAGIAFILVSGWLGAEMVHVHGITVHSVDTRAPTGGSMGEQPIGPKRAA